MSPMSPDEKALQINASTVTRAVSRWSHPSGLFVTKAPVLRPGVGNSTRLEGVGVTARLPVTPGSLLVTLESPSSVTPSTKSVIDADTSSPR